MYRQISHRTRYKHTFLSAHFTHDHTCGSTHFVCLKKHFAIGHVFAEHSFNPVSSYFLFKYNLADATDDLTDATDWNHIEPCAASLGDGLPGHLAGPIPTTTCPVSDCCCKTSWKNFLIIASVVSGGNLVATARMDLSVSSCMSFGVVRFACSSCSSLYSVAVSRSSFSWSMKVMEDRICCISWSFLLFVCALTVSCVFMVCALSVHCSSIRTRSRYSSMAGSRIFAFFGLGSTLAGWSWCPPPKNRSVCWIVLPFSMS